MQIGDFTVPDDPFRLPTLVKDLTKVYETYKEGMLERANNNDVLAQLLGYKSSNNGAFRARLRAMVLYGLLEGRGDMRITDLGKQITYGNEQERYEAHKKAVMTLPLWKELYSRYRLDLPKQDFWSKLANLVKCEPPVAKSNEKFILEAFEEDTSYIRSIKEPISEEMDLTRLDQEVATTPTQFIEVKAGPFYQRLPYTAQGKKVAMEFLQSLEITETKTEKTKGEK